MFERSMVISQQSHASATQRWTAAASITVQVALASVVIALPLLHPERLAFQSAPPLYVPSLQLAKAKPIPVERSAAHAITNAMLLPAAGPSFTAPPTIPHGISKEDGPALVTSLHLGGSGLSEALGTVATGAGSTLNMVPTRAAIKPVRVSGGVVAGMLLAPIRPVYPAIAKAAHVEGAVVVEAVISKTGSIESLHVSSGSPMLREAAMEAIRAARYQPYRLNGEPTEVQTTVTVNFRISS